MAFNRLYIDEDIIKDYTDYIGYCMKIGLTPYSYEDWKEEFNQGIALKLVDAKMIKQARGGEND